MGESPGKDGVVGGVVGGSCRGSSRHNTRLKKRLRGVAAFAIHKSLRTNEETKRVTYLPFYNCSSLAFFAVFSLLRLDCIAPRLLERCDVIVLVLRFPFYSRMSGGSSSSPPLLFCGGGGSDCC